MSGLTLDRATYDRLVSAWASFGEEWADVRAACTAAGFPFPPSGTAEDDRDDPEPSQRAILWRALDYRRRSTLDIIGRSRSWSQVVARVLVEENGVRELAVLRERETEYQRDEPDPREATVSLKRILERIGQS